MLIYWFIFLAISLAISLVMLLYVQLRMLWRQRRPDQFPPRSSIETFWTDLSVIQRVLMYSGLVAVLITIAGDMLRKLFVRS